MAVPPSFLPERLLLGSALFAPSLALPCAARGDETVGAVQSVNGSDAHIPLGPPDEADPTHITFDFAKLPRWAFDGWTIVVPTSGVILRIVVVRQIAG